MSTNLHPCLHSHSFSKSTWVEWTWTLEVECSGKRREKLKWPSLSSLKPGKFVLWSALKISILYEYPYFLTFFYFCSKSRGYFCVHDPFISQVIPHLWGILDTFFSYGCAPDMHMMQIYFRNIYEENSGSFMTSFNFVEIMAPWGMSFWEKFGAMTVRTIFLC